MGILCAMARRRHLRSDMERHLLLRDAEGLTLAALAARTGISINTLSYWSVKLRREAIAKSASGFVELADPDSRQRPSPPQRPSVATPQDSSVRIQHPSGATFEFRGHAADIAVGGLLREFASWS
jgi:hypothetical protein